MADFGVHRVGEIDRRGLRRQGDDLALRSEHIHFGSAQILLERTKEFVGIRGLARPVGKLLNPLEVVGLAQLLVFAALAVRFVRRAQRAAGLTVLLVLPVGGDTEFGTAVHVPRTNLDLHRFAAGTHHRGVQALVHVELRHGDVILEASRNRAPPRVHGAQRRIAVLNSVDDDAHTDQIVDVGEIMAADDHLLVDREVVLRSSRHACLDVLVVEILVDFGKNLLQIHVTLAGATRHQHHDLVVNLRVQHLEAEFLKLRLDGVHAQTVGERRIHVEGLTGLALGT